MSGSRPELVARILSRRASVSGKRIDTSLFSSLCGRLAEARVRSSDVVMLTGLQGRDVVLAAMAVWQLDAVPMPVSANAGMSSPLREVCRITSELAVIPAQAAGRIEGLDGTAVLHMSSGTTAQPKIVKRGVESVLAEAEGYRLGLSLVPEDHVAVPVPLVHSLGWGVAMSALLNGCHVDAQPFVRAGTLASKIDSGAVSVLALTPPLARLLIGSRRRGAPRLRVAMAGAGQVTDDLNKAFEERFGQPLVRGYGSTETGGTFLGDTGMGNPVPGVEVAQPLPGTCGELVLRLLAPVEGYLGDRRGATREWHTGDFVQHEPDGTVLFIERLRGQLRLNGRFIDADAVDKALREVPGVKDVVLLVVPRREAPEFEDFYAFVETGDVGKDSLVTSLAGTVGETPIPYIIQFPRMPRNVIGKPDRDLLLEMVRRVGSDV